MEGFFSFSTQPRFWRCVLRLDLASLACGGVCCLNWEAAKPGFICRRFATGCAGEIALQLPYKRHRAPGEEGAYRCMGWEFFFLNSVNLLLTELLSNFLLWFCFQAEPPKLSPVPKFPARCFMFVCFGVNFTPALSEYLPGHGILTPAPWP